MWFGMLDGSTMTSMLCRICSSRPPLSAHALRHADEHERQVDDDLLAGDQLHEVDVEDLLLERVALDLADQRVGGRAAERELDDRAAGGDGARSLSSSRALSESDWGSRPWP